jgi:hypothetical protein
LPHRTAESPAVNRLSTLFTDDELSAEGHAWLDQLTQAWAIDFAAEQGYDLKDYIHGGCVADWWGFTWMILAEARGGKAQERSS